MSQQEEVPVSEGKLNSAGRIPREASRLVFEEARGKKAAVGHAARG